MNKIIVSIILAVILVVGINKITNVIYNVEKPEKSAYKVEIIEDSPTSSSKVEKAVEKIDIVTLLALGNIEHGEKVFKKCAACHSVTRDGGNKIGPKLWNVMFRPVASITDYKYSKALLDYKKEWSWAEMNGFLIKPSKWIKGNKMGFAGLKNEKDRASIILYLNENSDNPKPLP